MTKKAFYIEKRDDNQYAVERTGSKRASAITSNQAEAIERAKQLDPEAPIHVARVRRTSKGKPDQFRKL